VPGTEHELLVPESISNQISFTANTCFLSKEEIITKLQEESSKATGLIGYLIENAASWSKEGEKSFVQTLVRTFKKQTKKERVKFLAGKV
jgi:hypothetical protein